MTLSPLQKSFVSSLCVGSTVFTAAAVPLAVFGSQSVEVQMQNQPVFASEMRALAGPYLGLAGTFSAAVGAGIMGMSGWRLAARRSEADKAKSSELERSLLAYQAELERIKFSDARLKAQALEAFLEQDQVPNSSEASAPMPAAAPAVAEPTPSLAAVPATQHKTLSTNSGHTAGQTPSYGVLDRVMREASAAQYLVSQPTAVAPGADAALTSTPLTAVSSHSDRPRPVMPMPQRPEAPSENKVDVLLHQLRDVAAQLEDLQRAGNSTQAAA